MSETPLARVVGVHGRHGVIELPGGQRLLAHSRGKKSETVVGDLVRWQPAGDEAVVEAIEPRASLLKRQDEWRSKNFAANVQLLLVMVAVDPPYGESQLSRALIAAADARIPALIVLNKIDLPGADAARERLAPYRAMGISVIEVALKSAPEAASALLLPRMEGCVTLVLGPSGMGKSTLVNLLVPQADAQVGEISRALRAGRHTTTTTTWYWLDEAHRTALIDSPGFQEFGLHHIAARDLAGLMPDFAAHLGHCRFANCMHLHEPGCGVREAIARGEITPSRQRIYEALIDELTPGSRS
ncbi:MAG TPA: ribosome small subunit-dependent GTPase A [Burkholderiaceae bacterium]|nr:ribosome small subunit-dependent GTPase A [Burkholderiaceae bacterium]